MLLDDSAGALLPPDEAVIDAISSATLPEQGQESLAQPATKDIVLHFDKTGSLGIEFERLSAPYVVEALHEGGLAFGSGLETGDRLTTVDGLAVDALDWDSLVPLLTSRPVALTFVRDPEASRQAVSSPGGALLSGFAGRMRTIGGNVAQTGLASAAGLGTAGLGLAQQGLAASGKMGSVVGNVGTVAQQGWGLGLGSVAQQGLGLSSRVGSVTAQVGSVTASLLGGTLEPTASSGDDGGIDTDGGAAQQAEPLPPNVVANSETQAVPAARASTTEPPPSALMEPEEAVSSTAAPAAVPATAAPPAAEAEVILSASEALTSGVQAVVSTSAQALSATEPADCHTELKATQDPQTATTLLASTSESTESPWVTVEAGTTHKAVGGTEPEPLASAAPQSTAIDEVCSLADPAAASEHGVVPDLTSVPSDTTAAISAPTSAATGPDAEASNAEAGQLEQVAVADTSVKPDAFEFDWYDEADTAQDTAPAPAPAPSAAQAAEDPATGAGDGCLGGRPPGSDSSGRSSWEDLAGGGDAQPSVGGVAVAPAPTLGGAEVPLQESVGAAHFCLAGTDTPPEKANDPTEVRKQAEEIQRLKVQLDAAKALNGQLQEELKQTGGKVVRLEGELAVAGGAGTEAQRLGEALAASERRAEEAIARCAALEAEAEAAQAQAMAAADSQRQAAEREANEVRQAHEADSARLREESAKEVSALRSEQARLQAAMQEKDQGITEQATMVKRLQDELAKSTSDASSQLEQLRFALAEKERQLQEKVEVITKKEQEVKSLLRQLAAVGDGAASPTEQQQQQRQQQQRQQPPDETDAATQFDVLFALEGPLGLEFQKLSAPYIVTQVHENKVATGLGIMAGDELVGVADSNVTEAPWETLVQRLSTRPVVARFRRDPARLRAATEQDDGFMTSMSSVGSSLLTKARGVVPVGAQARQAAELQDGGRLQAELERLTTLLKARDEELLECGDRLKQRDEALRLLEAGDAAAGETARLAQEREFLAQRVEQLQARLGETEAREAAEREARERVAAQCAEEARLKEEFRLQATALNDQNNSLMTQFETLRGTCQSLHLDVQQKGTLEHQVQELMRMNAQWQQAHQSLNDESATLRQHAAEKEKLQSEVGQLRRYEQLCHSLESRLREAEAHSAHAHAEVTQLRNARAADQVTIQRLQAVVESVQETGESQAGYLESELLERSRECASQRRELEEQRKRVEELVKRQQEMREAAEQGQAMRAEADELRERCARAEGERDSLSGVVERCVEKLEKDSRERPHLVDKRMVTQMVAAYLEQRDNPRQQQEIMARMADLLGFSTSEREQVGLAQSRRTLLQEEPASLNELTDRFVDFLFEEAES